MSQEIINTGALPNDGEGDPLRVAFTKINNNFSELFSESSAEGPNGAIQYSLLTSGFGAAGYSQITDGSVTNVVIQSYGSGYKDTNPPVVVFTNAPGDTTGSGVQGIAEVVGGQVTSVTILDGGTNYTLAPLVTFLPTTDAELQGSANLVYNTTTNSVNVGANIIPLTTDVYTLGNANLRFRNLFVGQNGVNLGNVVITETGNVLTFSVSANTQVKSNIVVSDVTANSVSANSINTGGNSIASSTVVSTIDNATDQVLLQIPITQFSTGEFNIESRVNNNATQVQSVTINGTKIDSTSVKHVAHSTIFSNSIIVNSYDLDVVGGNLRLKVSPAINVLMNHKVNYKVNL